MHGESPEEIADDPNQKIIETHEIMNEVENTTGDFMARMQK